jgi:hypothetical protein
MTQTKDNRLPIIIIKAAITGVIMGGLVVGLLATLSALGIIPDPNIGLSRLGVLLAALSGIGAGSVIGLIIGVAAAAVRGYQMGAQQLFVVAARCHEGREREVRSLLSAAGAWAIHSQTVGEKLPSGYSGGSSSISDRQSSGPHGNSLGGT